MHDRDWLAEKFQQKRSRLRAVAYRMLGSLNEADDAIQEAWLRLNRSDASVIANLDGWLTTVIARVCLDVLRTRESRREEPLDRHLPDLIVSGEDGMDPAQQALIADSVGIALLVVLETLGPAERLAYVLHDMFAVPFEEIAKMAGCTAVAARQLASRARRRVRGVAPIPDVDLKQQRKVVDAFFAAARAGDFDALVAVLDPDVVVRSDMGTLREVRGSRTAAEGALLFSHLAERVQPVLVNGVAGIVSRRSGGQVFAVMSFVVKGGRIAEIDVIRDPSYLRRLDLTSLSAS
jgi:RNA polymerase sigma-70 factor (ECF subfamily)